MAKIGETTLLAIQGNESYHPQIRDMATEILDLRQQSPALTRIADALEGLLKEVELGDLG